MSVKASLAIFGGTFDPVHNGHLKSALELKQRLPLDRVFLLPCHLPPHRDMPGCTSEQRLDMLRLAVAGTELLIDDRELWRERTSYSVETLEDLRCEYGDEISICWVMGTDAFAGFDRWHRWQDFLSLSHIIVITRPNESLPTSGPLVELIEHHRASTVSELQQVTAGRIWFETLTPYDISATAVRAAIAGDEPVADMLPADVLHYIQQHRLYIDV